MRTPQQNLEDLNQCITAGSQGRVPCVIFMNFPFISSVTGIRSAEYFGDMRAMLEAQVETCRRLGTDGPLSPDYGTVAEASAFGAEVVWDHTGIPSIHANEGLTLEKMAAMKAPNPCTDGYMARQLECLAYMKAHAPKDMRVSSCNTMAPLTAAASMRGISDFCADIMEEPELVARVLNLFTRTEIACLKEQQKILGGSLDRVLLSDDISSFLNAGQFRQLVMPVYEKIYGAFPEAQRWLHNDGSAGHLAAAIAEAGIQLWHVGKDMDMSQLFALTGGRVALCGNLHPIGLLLNGTASAVREEAKKQIQKYRNTGKYVLSTGGFLSYGTPVGHVLAMTEAAGQVD